MVSENGVPFFVKGESKVKMYQKIAPTTSTKTFHIPPLDSTTDMVYNIMIHMDPTRWQHYIETGPCSRALLYVISVNPKIEFAMPMPSLEIMIWQRALQKYVYTIYIYIYMNGYIHM